MGEVDKVELAIGSEGVVYTIQEWSCEFEVSFTCATDNGFALVADVEEFFLLGALQQLLLEKPKSNPIAHLPTLVELEQKSRIYIRLGYPWRLSP